VQACDNTAKAGVKKQALDQKVEALEELRSAPPAVACAQLRKALADRNNWLVSKAAALVAGLSLSELIPDLLAAFDRFLIDAGKSDPQCWAKTAIAKALKDLGHRDAQVFLAGFAHVQLEPVWGGRADSAATLRGTCALALVECQLPDLTVLGHLTGGLADPEKTVRIDTAIAIAQLARAEGALLLRLKTLLGDADPEVMGQCFLSLLSLDTQDPVQFIRKFLDSKDDDIRLEAACALAQSRDLQALSTLQDFWRQRLSPEMRRAVLMALGASPLREGAEFLLAMVGGESKEQAEQALRALAASRFRADVKERIAAVVEKKQDSNLKQLFGQYFV
jgi:HEAT repeat protein